MVPVAVGLILLALAGIPTATAASNTFATLVMTGFPESDGSPVDVTAEATFKPGPGADAFRYLVAYRTSSDHVTIRLDTATLRDGRPATIERQDTNVTSKQSRMWIRGPAPEGLAFHGVAATDANGRFHIGVLLIPFDAQWKQVANANGTPLQVYEYTLLSGIGVDQGPLFVGSGNVPGPSALAAGVAVALAVWARRPIGNS